MDLSYISEALAYVEAHLSDDLDVNTLSRAFYVSPMQLYRDFYSATGHPIKEYIRKRRLSEALCCIRASRMSLAEVAAEYGYGSQQALCKKVRASIGMTPLEYKRGEQHFFFARYSADTPFHISVQSEKIPSASHLVFSQGSPEGIENQAVRSLFSAFPGYTGRLFGRNGKKEDGSFAYHLFIEEGPFEKTSLTDSGFTIKKPAPQRIETCVRLLVANREPEIRRAWDYLYNDWLRGSLFQPGNASYFEEYLHKKGTIRKLALFLPVKKRNGLDTLELCPCQDMHFIAAGANTEESAAQRLMDFLVRHYPDIARGANRFYVANGEDEIHCGIALEQVQPIEELMPGIRLYTHRAGIYALLKGACCGSSNVYDTILLQWVQENGFKAEGKPFTVYSAEKGFETEKIRTETYLRIQSDT